MASASTDSRRTQLIPVAPELVAVCTLTLAWQLFEDTPIAVAANRDEAIEREAEPPARFHEEPLVVAPRDVAAGGTWIGVNEYGLVAGLTNKWGSHGETVDRSRGLLVADVLTAQSVADALDLLTTETTTRTYQGFYLVVADPNDAVCYVWDGDRSVIEFEPGVHVVGNATVDDTADIPATRSDVARTQVRNTRRVRAALQPTDGESASAWLERAGKVLGDHEYGVCLHGDGFGTRSSSLLAVGEPTSYQYADGPPCRTAYTPIAIPTAIDRAPTDESQV